MLSKRIAIALAAAGCLSAAVATAQNVPPAATPGPAAITSPADPGNVKVYRLRYADPEAVANQLSAAIRSPDVRVVAAKTLGSIIVLGPPAVQQTAAELVSKLDVPPSSHPATATGPEASPNLGNNAGPEVSSRRPGGQGPIDGPGRSAAVLRVSPEVQRALSGIGSTPGNVVVKPAEPHSAATVVPPASATQAAPPAVPIVPATPVPPYSAPMVPTAPVVPYAEPRAPAVSAASSGETTISVVRVSPETRRALEGLAAQPGQPQAQARAAEMVAGPTSVFRIPTDEVSALASALAELAASRGSQIIVIPPKKPAQEANRPTVPPPTQTR